MENMCIDRQIDRQTDRQTDRRTNKLERLKMDRRVRLILRMVN